MRYSFILLFTFLLLILSEKVHGTSYSFISPKALAAKTKKPCTLVHFWAAWCEVCVQELPLLLPKLAQKKNITLVVVDLSQGLAQETFSLPWLTKIAPTATTFHKGKLPARKLVGVVDEKWQGGLPYSALFSKGKKMIDWKGSVSFSEFETHIAKHCGPSNP